MRREKRKMQLCSRVCSLLPATLLSWLGNMLLSHAPRLSSPVALTPSLTPTRCHDTFSPLLLSPPSLPSFSLLLLSPRLGSGVIEEQLGSLKQRLDNIMSQAAGGPALQENGGEMDNASNLPPAVLAAAGALFQTRNGRPPMGDIETASMLRSMLLEAGILSGGRKTMWKEMVAGMPPPPPPMINASVLPPSVLSVAAALGAAQNFPKGMDPEIREQRELQGLQKQVSMQQRRKPWLRHVPQPHAWVACPIRMLRMLPAPRMPPAPRTLPALRMR